MLEKLAEYQSQLEQIDVQLFDGATMKDMNLYKKLPKSVVSSSRSLMS